MTRLHLTYAEEGHPVPARQVRQQRGEKGGNTDWGGQSKSIVRLCEEDPIKVWSRILLLTGLRALPALCLV